MPHPDIILVGASVRSLAESAIRDGLTPFCVDMFGDADLLRLLDGVCGDHRKLFRQISEFNETTEALRGVSKRIPVLISGGIENDSDLLLRLTYDRPLLGSPPHIISELRNPAVLFPMLEQNKVAVPVWKPSIHSDVDAEHRWLRKSFRSAGGQGVSWLVEKATTQRSSNLSELGSYVQQFVSGPVASATFLVTDGRHPTVGTAVQNSVIPAQAGTQPRTLDSWPRRHEGQAPPGNDAPIVARAQTDEPTAKLIGVSLQISGASEIFAPEFHFSGNLGPLTVPSYLRQQIEHAGQVVSQAWPVSGFFGIDFVVDDSRVIVLEVNPRVTASHELYEWANPNLPGHVALQLAIGPGRWPSEAVALDTAASDGHRRYQLLRLVVYANECFTLTESAQQKMLQRSSCQSKQTSAVWLADIPPAGTRIPAGTPLCSVYLRLIDDSRRLDLFDHDVLVALCSAFEHLPPRIRPKPEPLLRRLQDQITLLQTDPHLAK